MHNQRMTELAEKNVRWRGLLCRTLEEAIRFCEINDHTFINLRSQKKDEKLVLSKLNEADWIESVNLTGFNLSGQRFPKNLTELRHVSLIRCNYDLEAITELDQVTSLRLTVLAADVLEQLSHKTNLTRFEMFSSTYRPELSDKDLLGSVKDLGFLKDWKQIKRLVIVGYPELDDISALADKKELKTLEFNRCPRISSIDVLKNLSGLRMVRITDCAVAEEQLEEISKALPECTVISDKYDYIGGEKRRMRKQ